jgi:hypothetical protein
MKYIKNSFIISYIFCIFPLLFVTGSFLPDLFICLVDIYFLFLFYKNIKKIFYKNYYLYFLLAFFLYINFNSIIAYNSYYSFKVSLPYIRFLLFSFIFSYLLINIKNLRKIIIFSFLVVYFILLVDSLIQIVVGKDLMGYSLNGNRISSLFGDWLVMGSFVARTMPVILGITFFEKINYKNILQTSILIISGILVIMSAERLAFAYYLITLSFFIFFKISKKNLFIIISLIIIICSSIFYLRPDAYNRLFKSTISQLRSADSIMFFSYRHELHYLTAFNEFKDSIIFGHGVKSFRLLCENPKYVPTSKIIKDNMKVSPVDGYSFFLKDKKEIPVVVIKKNNRPPSDINDSDIIYKLNYNGQLIKIYVSDGQFVKKNQQLLSAYEFMNGCNTHPHNIHVQFLAETGFIGYIFLIIAFLFIIYQLFLIFKKHIFFKSINNQEYYVFFCLLGLFLSLFPIFPSGNFFNNWMSSIFYFNVANLISILPLKK